EEDALPDQRRRQVVAQRQGEGENRPGDDTREGEREYDVPERRPRARTEVTRSFDIGTRNTSQRGIDRQHREGEPEVAEGDPKGDARPRQIDTEPGEQLVDRPTPFEEGFPREHPDQV